MRKHIVDINVILMVRVGLTGVSRNPKLTAIAQNVNLPSAGNHIKRIYRGFRRRRLINPIAHARNRRVNTRWSLSKICELRRLTLIGEMMKREGNKTKMEKGEINNEPRRYDQNLSCGEHLR